jgi:RHS repeat-associated protein
VVKHSNATYTPGLYERRSGSTRQLHHNLKNVELQTTLTPAVSASRTYDAFGNVLSSTGTHRGPFGNGGGFGYQEDATGLKLLGHRLYDSSTGRFLTRDPIKAGRNWYVYSDSEPVGYADPDGLDKLIIYERGGGFGGGAHATIGLEDSNGNREYFGFYPSLPRPGKSSGSSDSSKGTSGSSSKGTGPGYVNFGDRPGKGGSYAEREISPEERRRIRRAIINSAKEYNIPGGQGKEYNVRDFNCTHWALSILLASDIGAPDYIVEGESGNKTVTMTPKNLREWLESW